MTYKPKEGFERPKHPDFLTARELQNINFSGLRHNSILDVAELWILGQIAETVSAEQVKLNPLAINEAYERVFGLAEVMPDTADARAYVAIRNAKRRD